MNNHINDAALKQLLKQAQPIRPGQGLHDTLIATLTTQSERYVSDIAFADSTLGRLFLPKHVRIWAIAASILVASAFYIQHEITYRQHVEELSNLDTLAIASSFVM